MVSVIENQEEYENICKFLNGNGASIRMSKHIKKRLKKKSESFYLADNLLYLKNEEGLHKRVFHGEQLEAMKIETTLFHKKKHYGVNRFEKECNQFYFKIPRDIIRKVVAECVVCAQSQPLKVKEKQVHILAKRPMERLMIDLIDMKRYKEENEGYSWILTIIDVYSKFSWAFPLKTKTGKEVADTLESFFYRYTGPPTILQSDNGKEFINSEMAALQEKFSFVFKHSRPRHPQAQGQVERFNQTLSRYLQKHIFEEEFGTDVDLKQWLKHLNVVIYNYNSAIHSATGKTPFRLFMGIPGFNTVRNQPFEEEVVIEKNDFIADICEDTTNTDKEGLKETFSSFLESSSDKIWEPSVSSTYLNRMDRHSLVHLSKYDIEVGDTVMISIDFDSNTNTKKLKLSSFFSEPSQVTEMLSNNRIKIKNEHGEEIVHLSRVKKIK